MTRSTMEDQRADFRDALGDGDISLYFQPIISLRTGTVQGVEALMRWQDPVRGLLAADAFLPELADSPVMAAATRWVLEEACRALIELPNWSMAINISAHDLGRPGLVNDVVDALTRHNIEPTRLTVETTEADIVAHTHHGLKVLTALRSRGVGLSLGNFGSTNTSLPSLRDLPFSELKLGRDLVAGMGEDRGLAIVTSVVKLAKTLGIGIVAEGVETQEQASILSRLQCPHAQGFLWGRPTPANDLDTLYVTRHATELHEHRTPWPVAVRESAGPAAMALIAEHRARGSSLYTIAGVLNSSSLPRPGAARWTSTAVAHLLTRPLK